MVMLRLYWKTFSDISFTFLSSKRATRGNGRKSRGILNLDPRFQRMAHVHLYKNHELHFSICFFNCIEFYNKIICLSNNIFNFCSHTYRVQCTYHTGHTFVMAIFFSNFWTIFSVFRRSSFYADSVYADSLYTRSKNFAISEELLI